MVPIAYPDTWPHPGRDKSGPYAPRLRFAWSGSGDIAVGLYNTILRPPPSLCLAWVAYLLFDGGKISGMPLLAD
jgi:hypothetical protein